MVRCFCAFLGLFLIEVAYSYPTPVDFDGKVLRWNITADDEPITYNVEAEDGFEGVFDEYVDEAAELWSQVPSSYFTYERVEEDGDVTIKLKSTITGGGFSAGFATFDKYNGDDVAHCTIEIQVGTRISLVAFSKTVLHELGHCLGLGHSMVPESIMSYELAKNDFQLDTDDIAAVSRLYPADGSPASLPPGCALGYRRRFEGGVLVFFFVPFLFLFSGPPSGGITGRLRRYNWPPAAE